MTPLLLCYQLVAGMEFQVQVFQVDWNLCFYNGWLRNGWCRWFTMEFVRRVDTFHLETYFVSCYRSVALNYKLPALWVVWIYSSLVAEYRNQTIWSTRTVFIKLQTWVERDRKDHHQVQPFLEKAQSRQDVSALQPPGS